MPININHPYINTPYDILSVPEDASIGILSIDACHKVIMNRYPLLIKWWNAHLDTSKKRTEKITELAKALNQTGFPGRIIIDAFLYTLLEKAGDFDELIQQQQNLPLNLSASLDDWETGLEAWQAVPIKAIVLDEISISKQDDYDDAQIDLYEVQFNS